MRVAARPLPGSSASLMPHCYLLTISAGSSLDQQSNTISLFQLIEQVNVPANAPPPAGGQLPLEIHAYFRISPLDIGKTWEMRFVLVAPTGLETYSDIISHRVVTPRFRTKTWGVPFPPVLGHYELRVDVRSGSDAAWERDALSWPIAFLTAEQAPAVTH